jgi:hypothetical protein
MISWLTKLSIWRGQRTEEDYCIKNRRLYLEKGLKALGNNFFTVEDFQIITDDLKVIICTDIVPDPEHEGIETEIYSLESCLIRVASSKRNYSYSGKKSHPDEHPDEHPVSSVNFMNSVYSYPVNPIKEAYSAESNGFKIVRKIDVPSHCVKMPTYYRDVTFLNKELIYIAEDGSLRVSNVILSERKLFQYIT